MRYWLLATVFWALTGCGTDGVGGGGDLGGTGGTGGGGGGGGDGAMAGGDGSMPPDLAGPTASAIGRCGDPVPPGAAEAADLPVYAGTCPAFATAPNLTTIQSGNHSRKFMVVVPQSIAAGEKLPVIFVWHWLGGDPEDVFTRLGMQEAVDLRRFIAVIPESKGDILFKWPFGISQPDSRLDEELAFFDDMLACVAAGYAVDKNCVSSTGISAGALMTAQLASRRSTRLSSFATMSGGVDGLARPWAGAAHKLPAMILWGGPSDMYPDNVPLEHFDDASMALESAMAPDGHFLLECVHNCGHSLPPFDVPAAGSGALFLDPLWRFLLDHPYWLPVGTSPYQATLPASVPSWCGLGMGKATPRAADAVCP